MAQVLHRPAFITFTGVDRADALPEMVSLSKQFPIEWGVLIDPEQEGTALFPEKAVRTAVQAAGLRLSAHICGQPARDIVNGTLSLDLRLSGFSRLQINHGREGASEEQIHNAHRFAVTMGMRPALQCQGAFPSESRADWLYDVSFGLGTRPSTWPELAGPEVFCGYSGGISPETVVDTLAALPLQDGDDKTYWIDMESGVRADGVLDIARCKQVCELVYGK